jgi:hypothetical protein
MTIAETDLSRSSVLKLGNQGELYFLRGEGSLYHKFDDITKKFQLPDLVDESCFIDYWFNECLGVVLLCDSEGLKLFCLDLLDERGQTIPLNRSEMDDSGVFRQQFVDSREGPLFVYEGGLISFNQKGAVRWRVDHQQMDRVFVGIRDACAWYESEYEGSWGYRLSDGKKVR